MGDRERLLAAIDEAFERLTARVFRSTRDDTSQALAVETLQRLRERIDSDPAWAARLVEEPEPSPTDHPPV